MFLAISYTPVQSKVHIQTLYLPMMKIWQYRSLIFAFVLDEVKLHLVDTCAKSFGFERLVPSALLLIFRLASSGILSKRGPVSETVVYLARVSELDHVVESISFQY